MFYISCVSFIKKKDYDKVNFPKLFDDENRFSVGPDFLDILDGKQEKEFTTQIAISICYKIRTSS